MEKFSLINMINHDGEIRRVSEYTTKVDYYYKFAKLILVANAIVWCTLIYLFQF